MNQTLAEPAADSGLLPASPSAGLAANLRATLRASAFRRVPAAWLAPRPAQLLALVVLVLVVELGFAIASSGGSGELDWPALPRALFYVPLALLAGLFVAWREDAPERLLQVAILVAGIRLWYAFLFGALDLAVAHDLLGAGRAYDSRGEDLWYVVYALWLLAMVRAVAGISNAGRAAAVARAAVAVAVLAVPLWLIPGADLWRVRGPAEGLERDWFAAAREEVIYAQPALLDRALGRLVAQRPGVPDLYFVGVAGYAAEDVFMKEVGVLDGLFRERFDAEGRSIVLVNNPTTVASQPVASTTALARTLQHVGGVMDRDEDVLFLYLTSHGSEDHRFAMEFWPLKLNDMDPHTLRQMLDRAGIKWRVIAISACYAGGFIDALRDDHTLVVTAADANHQSFGCGTESDFTYFGHAWDTALRKTYSFTEAFEQARRAIAEREKAEALTPSNPQIYVGKLMAEKLSALSARLKGLRH